MSGAVVGEPKKSFTCLECGKAFNSVWYLKQHAVKHSKDRPFTCKYCSRTYRFRSNLYQHKCPQRDLASGQTHKSSKPKKKKARLAGEGEPKLVQPTVGGCLPPADTITRPLCGLNDSSCAGHNACLVDSGGRLCWMNEGQPAAGAYGGGGGGPLLYAGVSEAVHKCHRCCMVFPNQEYLTRHLSWHRTEERKMQCSRCSELFENELLHDAHQQLHSVDAGHVCTFCLGKFCHRLALKRHMVRCSAHRTTGWIFSNGTIGTFSPQPQAERQQSTLGDYDHHSVGGSSSGGSSSGAFSQSCLEVAELPYAAPNGDSLCNGHTFYTERNGLHFVGAEETCPIVLNDDDSAWYAFDQSCMQTPTADFAWSGTGTVASVVDAPSSSDGWTYPSAMQMDGAYANGQSETKGQEYMHSAAYSYNASVEPVMVYSNSTQVPGNAIQQQQQPSSSSSSPQFYNNYPGQEETNSSAPGDYGYMGVVEELSCNACSLHFESSEALHDHFIRSHVLNHCAPRREEPAERADWELPPTPCSICGVCFDGEEALRAHVLADHRPDKRFTCNHCGQTFNRRHGLKRHAAICPAINGDSESTSAPLCKSAEVKADLKCKHCSKVFTVKRYLKQHEISQHKSDEEEEKRNAGQTVVTCPLCPKTFSAPKLLKQHVSFHARANSL